MHPAFTGQTQKANMTGLSDHEEIIERMALLLATVAVGLVGRGIGHSVPSRQKGGDVNTSFDCLVVRRRA
jgi:hypothetical protein